MPAKLDYDYMGNIGQGQREKVCVTNTGTSWVISLKPYHSLALAASKTS